MEGRTDTHTTKLIVAFRYFAKGRKVEKSRWYTEGQKQYKLVYCEWIAYFCACVLVRGLLPDLLIFLYYGMKTTFRHLGLFAA